MLKEFFWGTPEEIRANKRHARLSRINRLSPAQQAELPELERLSRRLFLRRGATVFGIGAILSVGGIGINRLKNNSSPVDNSTWFRVEDRQLIGEGRINAAIKASDDWNALYQCGRDVTLKYIQAVESTKNGSVTSSEEKAEPGLIYITPRGDARKIILHAMTHACKPDQPTLLPEPFKILNGSSEIYGYHGLALLIRDVQKGQTMFTLFEEGIAERNAIYFPNYTYAGRNYGNIGRFTLARFPREQYPLAHDWVKNNNVPAFVNNLLSLPADHRLTNSDLEEAMFIYAETWNRR